MTRGRLDVPRSPAGNEGRLHASVRLISPPPTTMAPRFSHRAIVETLLCMASYTVNKDAVAHAEVLIDSRQYVLDSDWGERQPDADRENVYLEHHSWDDYAAWHLALTEGANDATKARYAFVFGDFRRVHRSGLIACVYRAAEWRHKQVELAAHQLLQRLDERSGQGDD